MANSQIIKIKKKQKKIITIYGKKYLKPIKVNVPNDPPLLLFFQHLLC